MPLPMNSNAAYFVPESSIVRTIWGKSDTILFIFAGSAAEFALNKAVDWLYYTGKLPADPLGRLFSTVAYARQIVFAETEKAHAAIDTISAIHGAIENKRGYAIPDWAYRDVLFMLIHYSIASYELLERKLTEAEKEEVYDVFYRLGARMQLKELPANYDAWTASRQQHLETDLAKSDYTVDLYKQYRKHLGGFRYKLLIESQKMVVPGIVREMLGFHKRYWLKAILPVYKASRMVRLDGFFKDMLLPSAYKQQIKALDRH
ncbi:MAG TPA: oxygenase MpaB family protein [Ferruginibacter sp.]|nr:oxygenase MpaB family protein [Ferruginibacter sp.]